jgi:hypothetical protein
MDARSQHYPVRVLRVADCLGDTRIIGLPGNVENPLPPFVGPNVNDCVAVEARVPDAGVAVYVGFVGVGQSRISPVDAGRGYFEAIVMACGVNK